MATCDAAEAASAVRWLSGIDRPISRWVFRLSILTLLLSVILLLIIGPVALIFLAATMVFMVIQSVITSWLLRRFLRSTDRWWLEHLRQGTHNATSALVAECRIRLRVGWRHGERGVALPEAISTMLAWLEAQAVSLDNAHRQELFDALCTAITQRRDRFSSEDLRPVMKTLSRARCALDRGRINPFVHDDI